MYIQITTKCNMHCAHCGYSCDKNGRHMKMATVRKAMKIAEDRGEYIFIGGGEPTLHPRFWDIMAMAMAASEERVGIVTNGSITEKAMILAKMDHAGLICAELSQDEFHDSINPRVVQAFKTHRNTSANIVAAGRAIDWGWDDGCICEGPMIDPEGKIWACGCKTEQFGTVDDPQIPDDYYDRESLCSEKYRAFLREQQYDESEALAEA